MNYEFRDLLYVDHIWSIHGTATFEDGSIREGLLEWCTSAEDAEARLNIMQNYYDNVEFCFLRAWCSTYSQPIWFWDLEAINTTIEFELAIEVLEDIQNLEAKRGLRYTTDYSVVRSVLLRVKAMYSEYKTKTLKKGDKIRVMNNSFPNIYTVKELHHYNHIVAIEEIDESKRTFFIDDIKII